VDGLFEFLTQNSLYVVLIIVLAVWIGIYGYLLRLETKIKNLEKQSHK